MLARADLTSRALTIYSAILAEHPKDVAALSGAGEAEFRLKNYPGAAVDLARALAYGATDPAVRADGEVANLVVSADPFQRRLGIRGRADRAAAAFAAATTRLAACQAAHPDAAELTALSDSADTLRPAAAPPKLARDPDRIDEIMDLVFSIESSVTARCGAPTGLDRALQILAETSKGER
jgi:hypothetical protein